MAVKPNIKWNDHIVVVCKRVAKSIFMIRKHRSVVSLDVLKAEYFAHIQSHLSYGVIVWGHSCNIRNLLELQKRAIRIMFNVNVRTLCKPLFKKLGILTVTSLYILQLM